MKLIAEIEGQQHALDVRRDGQQVVAEIDGRRYELTLHEPEPGVYLLLTGGEVFECRVGDAGGRQGVREVRVRDDVYNVALADPKRLRAAQSLGADEDGRVSLTAPMPGKVVRVMVEAGATVEAGDGLVVVEAMKMQNEMKSPKAGTVVELNARAGEAVNAGDVLVVVE